MTSLLRSANSGTVGLILTATILTALIILAGATVQPIAI